MKSNCLFAAIAAKFRLGGRIVYQRPRWPMSPFGHWGVITRDRFIDYSPVRKPVIPIWYQGAFGSRGIKRRHRMSGDPTKEVY